MSGKETYKEDDFGSLPLSPPRLRPRQFLDRFFGLLIVFGFSVLESKTCCRFRVSSSLTSTDVIIQQMKVVRTVVDAILNFSLFLGAVLQLRFSLRIDMFFVQVVVV